MVQHLGVLESAGMVTSTKVGRVRTYQLASGALAPAADWIGGQRLPAERRLDRLETHLANQPTRRNNMTDTIERSQTHATFVIERSMPAPVARVWRALSDNDERGRWFGGGDAFEAHEQSHDFRVGGRAVEAGQVARWADQPVPFRLHRHRRPGPDRLHL